MADERFLYENISQRLRNQILGGSYHVGEKLPSMRRLSQVFGVSINTIMLCFRQLESDELIDIRPRSGVFVTNHSLPKICPSNVAHFPLLPVEVSLSEDIFHYMEPHIEEHLVRLGIALPAREIMPIEHVLRTMRGVTRRQPLDAWDYMHPHGYTKFTSQLAKRSLNYPVPIAQEDLIVTNGCMEAIELALRTVTQRGDTVAVETPSYYGTLLALEVMQRKALEIPTDYRNGICLDALEQVFKRQQVSACLVSCNAQNPLGFTMSEDRKQKLVKLATRYNIPLIENDIWGDTVYAGDCLPAKAYDEAGMVIYCNSFSKSLMPGIRLGWVAPGRFHHRLRELKQISSITTASTPQLLMARLMESGFYAQHVQQLRQKLAVQTQETVATVLKAFPEGTRIEPPTGGCVLWVGLPDQIDSRLLFDQALAKGIHIFPGSVFSAGPRHFDYLRLNAGAPLDDKLRSAITQLGDMAKRI
ncbi:PLP-dependent aminotransferase family protein [Paraperlucidibaca wandonensis]|jgi:DNA-binding transcriptional MocR family regulator|uniref:PLP-dependent aminotransferase family protein n=1 Tax=Paraperlucidibaca wandonensis TaxID=1268273 RepID=A0ABW3HCA0_9GAMM|tara:strand:+ start:238 stop:1656 length:1419 start_codon:yes stop_codon:yes gene_type:complete